MSQERTGRVISGGTMVTVGLLVMLAAIITVCIGFFFEQIAIAVVGGLFGIAAFIILMGVFTLKPNEAMTLVLFGKYKGTVRTTGINWVNPITKYGKMFVGVSNYSTQVLKVNDKSGNPIEIAAVIVNTVKDTAKASFDVDNVSRFINVQSETAIRHLANSYDYNKFRESTDVINKVLVQELKDRLAVAGVDVLDARISHLAYAPEIAQTMLRRQQAEAIIDARQKIVHGAVSMVDMALRELTAKKIVSFDNAQRASLVSNLMVVLCSDNETHQVVSVASSKD